MAGEDQALVGHRCVQRDGHAAGLTALFLGLAGPVYARSEGAAGGVKTAGDDGCADRKARGMRGSRSEATDDRRGFDGDGDKALVDSQTRSHAGVHLAGRHVDEVQAVALGVVLARDPGEGHHDDAVALQEPARAGEHLRTVPLEPQHLRRGVTGAQPVAGEGEDVAGGEPGEHLVADRLRTGVHPDRRTGEHPALGVDRDSRPAWPSTPMPRTSAGSKAPEAHTSAMVVKAPATQSSASCSTQPGAGVCSGYSRSATARVPPSASKATQRHPEVPMSTPR